MLTEADRTHTTEQGQEDLRLVAEFLDGGQSAFERLFNKYQQRLYSVCRWYLGSSSDAEDVVQDVFLDIYAGLTGFRGKSTFLTWAYRIAVRKCMERKRKKRDLPFEEHLELTSEHQEQGTDRIVLQQAMSMLPDKYRVVLILKYYQQLSNEEIAEVLECNIGQVKMRLHRARNRMKDLLSDALGGDAR